MEVSCRSPLLLPVRLFAARRGSLIGAPRADPPLSRFPLAGVLGNEKRLRVYGEKEAYPAARLSVSRHLQRPLDAGGPDLHPAREGAIADLDGHAYHLRASPLLRSDPSINRPLSSL